MSQNRTLIAYQTKSGATEDSAKKIANVLQTKFQLQIDLVNLSKQKVPNLSAYTNVVVGAGVKWKKVYSKPLKFLKSDFSGKKVAFFVSSGNAETPGLYASAKAEYVDETLAKYSNLHVIAAEAFGGHAKMFGITLIDNLDLKKVEAWAEILGKEFTQ